MDLSAFLLAWRTAALPDREVIDALVHPAHAGPSPALAAALARWPGTSYWSDEPEGRHLILTRPLGRRHREAWGLHLLLFAATFFTTTFVGAVLQGAIPFDPNPLALVLGTYPFPRDFVHAWATALSARCVTALLHSRARRPVVHRHDGRLHPAAHRRVGPPSAARRGHRWPDRGTRSGPARARDRPGDESPASRWLVVERDAAGAR